MIKGSVVLQIVSESQYKVMGQYIPIVEERPSGDILKAITRTFLNSPVPNYTTYRQFPYKYYSTLISNPENASKIFIIFVMDATESYEIVRIYTDQIKSSINEIMSDSNKLTQYLQQLIETRNKILEKLDKPKILQDQISAMASKLIDAGNFEEAQGIIILAKEIPGEIVSSYKTALKKQKEGNYKDAEKNYIDAYLASDKIKDVDLHKFLSYKIETVRQIPLIQKELKIHLTNIVKDLKKFPTLLSYGETLGNIKRVFEVYDILENDDKMIQINDLEKLIIESNDLTIKLQDLDIKIKNMLQNINSE